MSVITAVRSGVLSPVERFSEILFGLIMTLSFTGTMSVVSGGRQEVGTTLISVVGCNIAWGIIDAILYLIGAASDRGSRNALRALVRRSQNEQEARAAIADALSSLVSEEVPPEEVESIRLRILRLPETAHRRILRKDDFLGALAVFFLVVLSCVPVVFPFLIIQEPLRALRVSNAIAIVMLFFGGYFLAKYSGTSRVLTGLVMVALGVAMVGITIALGG
jgi:VIT1/CCC1 family predicted Fe2+/Mn2+ transporter